MGGGVDSEAIVVGRGGSLPRIAGGDESTPGYVYR